MDGYCDSAFRYICKKVAPQIVTFSEFYSADGLFHNKELAKKVLTHDTREHPVVFQIFGNNPDTFLAAWKLIESYGAQGVDINMGCPAKKVVKCGYGSGLMIDRERAMRIVSILAENLSIPVSVKTRLGWSDASWLLEFGQALENAWAQLITVHGRTFQQEYMGHADWNPIYELKKNVGIPVLGNGDCKSYDDGTGKIKNLSGFMIARACLWNPWCFLPDEYTPTWIERIGIMKEHMIKMIESKGEQRSCLEIRKHFVHYLHGFEWVKEYRKKLAKIGNVSEAESILNELETLLISS